MSQSITRLQLFVTVNQKTGQLRRRSTELFVHLIFFEKGLIFCSVFFHFITRLFTNQRWKNSRFNTSPFAGFFIRGFWLASAACFRTRRMTRLYWSHYHVLYIVVVFLRSYRIAIAFVLGCWGRVRIQTTTSNVQWNFCRKTLPVAALMFRWGTFRFRSD